MTKKEKNFPRIALKPINIRWIRLSPILKKLCITSKYIKFSTNIKIQIMKFDQCQFFSLGLRSLSDLTKLVLVLQFITLISTESCL